MSVPATPESKVAEQMRMVLREETGRLGVTVRVVQTGGVSLKQQLVRTDLAAGEPCLQGDCPACLSNPGQGGGLRHQRSGALYTGTCRLCAQQGLGTAVYTGESGFSGYERLCDHRKDIRKRDQGNTFAKQLREDHPNAEGEENSFNFDVVRTFRKPMERQIAEAVAIHGCQADTILKSGVRAARHQAARGDQGAARQEGGGRGRREGERSGKREREEEERGLRRSLEGPLGEGTERGRQRSWLGTWAGVTSPRAVLMGYTRP
jgi:hypothetical protein